MGRANLFLWNNTVQGYIYTYVSRYSITVCRHSKRVVALTGVLLFMYGYTVHCCDVIWHMHPGVILDSFSITLHGECGLGKYDLIIFRQLWLINFHRIAWYIYIWKIYINSIQHSNGKKIIVPSIFWMMIQPQESTVKTADYMHASYTYRVFLSRKVAWAWMVINNHMRLSLCDHASNQRTRQALFLFLPNIHATGITRL